MLAQGGSHLAFRPYASAPHLMVMAEGVGDMEAGSWGQIRHRRETSPDHRGAGGG